MDYVIKRNGTKVPFDKSKIVNAIEKAMTCTPGGIDARVSNAIADYIADMPDILSVEQIQDIVVNSLANSPFIDVADAKRKPTQVFLKFLMPRTTQSIRKIVIRTQPSIARNVITWPERYLRN